MSAGVENDPGPLDEPVLGAVYGHFRTTSVIGDGAMATVYEAVDESSGTVVALKVLKPHLAERSEVVSRFVREARALQNLPHPNIVGVHGHDVTGGGDAWIALERLRGVSLAALIRDEQRIHPRRAVRIATGIAAGLSVVHAHGVVHRDIKPENIFIVSPDTDNETAKLIDFGVARVSFLEMGAHSVPYTRMDAMLGTVLFAPPEQASGQKVDARADVFSLAVTLYEMLTGTLPYDGATVNDQVKAMLAGAVVPIRRRLKNEPIDPALEDLVQRSLSFSPESRPPDGTAMHHELDAIGKAMDAAGITSSKFALRIPTPMSVRPAQLAAGDPLKTTFRRPAAKVRGAPIAPRWVVILLACSMAVLAASAAIRFLVAVKH